MRSNFAVALVIAFALTGMMFGMSGFTDAIGHSEDTTTLEDAVNASADQGAVDDEGSGLSGDPRIPNDGTLIGFIVQGASQLLNVMMMVLLLPNTMTKLGFPFWFAMPVGVGLQIVASIGFVQFAVGRVLR